ncbi:TrkH family potassium uptake protein [Rossellomorea marisflavi]|uniref:TrkH family potassium uptake protein n=1 Tax=Rossellomorea TaxID=2837508 RepID=UPI00064FD3A1|nr:TrkH family potassium uptake protein [Rossellomorea marisflavi]KMK92629.1 Ktr system potassium transporter B [Rossellomorea marisflavi]KML05294.1 Ktr system potassium transporter B [Rossellomorea marisflavi]QHA37669.1 Ktr system potassium transporter B [Rossellomorea marisflavi]TYO69547.1 Ktr system potassium transporter B [Rossellomorea marisflavi]USK91573.1 TrkH family potassium uptake protein [Rossellomorea marisflavi]
MKYRVIHLSPPQLLVAVFAFFIMVGMALLKLPISTTEPITWLEALFTTTSAMTVTGLAVVDTGSVYTIFGQIVVMCLIQLGGLGIMSFAVLIVMMLGKKIGFKERLLLQQSLNQTSVGGVIMLVKYLFTFSLLVEGIGMTFLATQWVPRYGWSEGLFYSLFHSVSAFNNAGFGLWPDNMMRFVGNPVITFTLSFLFIIGGIGFTVLVDGWKSRAFKKLSLHSKIMILGTLLINVVATIIIFVLEYNNPGTLGPLSLGDKGLASYFQAVTPRTAGFNTLDYGEMESPTLFFTVLLMFIGAGSASTGGGIKLTTFLMILLAVGAFLRDKKEVKIFRRSIDQTVILKSLAISTLSVLLVVGALFILTISEKGADFLTLLFEVVSAFGTVGLSMNFSPELSTVGKWVIIFVMFAGKMGPLTLAYSLSRPGKEKIRYPKEDILTG